MTSSTAHIEITEPRRFKLGAVLIANMFGIFPALPVIASIVAISMMKMGPQTLLIPIAGLILSALLIPFGFGNPYITSLVRQANPDTAHNPDSFVVQLTLTPRLRSGLRALLEDADDIGVLTCHNGEISFSGDSVKLNLPLAHVSLLRPENVGWRGLYVSGRRIVIDVVGLPNVESLEFADRSAWLLLSSKRITSRITKKLSEHLSSK